MNKEKRAFITGGSRGIGKAMVDLFKKEGYLVATCSRNQKHLQNSLADLKLECDVSNASQVKKTVQALVQKWQKIDVVINNAGTAGSNSLNPEGDDALWHSIINTNLHGTYYTCKEALPYMPNQTGKIINIGSILSLIGVPDQTAYVAAKHGVLGFTKALSHLVAPREITVNCICPGWVETQMMEERLQDLSITKEIAKKEVPLKNIIQPEEVAQLALYLCSKQAQNITGQHFVIDGGSLSG